MLNIKIINFLLFQIAWFAAAYLHNNTGALICVSIALLNLFPFNKMFLQRLCLAVLLAIVGVTNDYILYRFNIISFPDQDFILLPLWLPSLWLAFSSTLHSSLYWLTRLNFLSLALLGGIAGTCSYIAGAKLGALQYQFSLIPAYALHFLNWLLLLPLLIKLQKNCAKKLRHNTS